MRNLILIFIAITLMISCKKASPVKSSDKEKENIAAKYDLVFYSNGWIKTLQGDAIGYKMIITLNKDATFKKEKVVSGTSSFLTGVFKDTLVHNYNAVVLKYNPQQRPNPNGYDALWDNVENGNEILFKPNQDSLLSINIKVADASEFRYKKTFLNLYDIMQKGS